MNAHGEAADIKELGLLRDCSISGGRALEPCLQKYKLGLNLIYFGCREREQSALRADSENLSPVLRDRLVARLRRTCPV